VNSIAKSGVEELIGICGKQRACSLFDLPRSSFYYRPVALHQQHPRGGGVQPHALSEHEREHIVDRLNSERLRNKSPRQAHAELLDDGEYLASPRTFARILASKGQAVDRQLQHHKQPRPVPRIVANDCNELWSWDTSPLATITKGAFFHLYAILDVFSRYAVCWSVEEVESAEIAEQLFRDAIATHDVDATKLKVHGDNGPIQRAIVIADCFSELGITKTHSRPHVSNDNAYSESLFKTAKYQPEYPWQFENINEARGWADAFFTHYNTNHYHSGIAMLTPASVYFGTADEIIERRQQTLDAAFEANPDRSCPRKWCNSGPPMRWATA
jgi:putative transposase